MKKGFTLTETLLTLVIIGIIAGITIPPVSVAVQKQVLKVKKQKAINTILSGYKQMLALYGGMDLTDVPMLYCKNSLCFAEEHNKIFNIIIDSLSDSIVDSFNNQNRYNAAYALTFEETYKTSYYDTFKVDWGKLPYSFITADGMIFGIKEIGIDNNIYLDIIVDTNCSKSPNRAGEDYLEFILDNKLNLLDISENANLKGNDDYKNDDLGTDNGENDTTGDDESPNYNNEYDHDSDYENPNKNDDDEYNDDKGNGNGNNGDNSYDGDDFNNEDNDDEDNDDENIDDDNDDINNDDENNDDNRDDDFDDNYDDDYNDDYDPNNPDREPWNHGDGPWHPGHHHGRPWHPGHHHDKPWHPDDRPPHHDDEYRHDNYPPPQHNDGGWYEPPHEYTGGNPGGGQGGMPDGHY